MTGVLEGQTILVTRPQEQAAPLVEAITQQGGTAIVCPSLDIVPLEIETVCRVGKGTPCSPLADAEPVVLFNSANAVRYGVPLLRQDWPTFETEALIIAQGPATQAALEAAGLSGSITPPAPYDSEAVLRLACWQQPARPVLLVRGRGGRVWLREALQARGHPVSSLEVYERRAAEIDFEKVLGASATNINVIISTSLESLQALYQQTTGVWRTWLLARNLLVISSGMADLARQLGFANSLLVADNASTSAILAALEKQSIIK
jgi:uroporphyrinogen-III synthase